MGYEMKWASPRVYFFVTIVVQMEEMLASKSYQSAHEKTVWSYNSVAEAMRA